MPARAFLGLALFIVAVAALGGVAVAYVPRNGQELPQVERARLLERAGLPNDFPVHPFARRMTQPAQGGFSYTLTEPVPDVLTWQQSELARNGYQVFNADIEGQDEYETHWLYFRGGDGALGAVIIRPQGKGAFRATEVKVLSTADARLVAK